MSRKVIVSMLIACASPMLVHAAEDPNPNRELLKQCDSSKGQVEKECEKVAKKMIKHPEAQERVDRKDQDITHSSPVMSTEPEPAEATSRKATPPRQADKKATPPGQADKEDRIDKKEPNQQ